MSSGDVNDDESQEQRVPEGDVVDGVYRSQFDLFERTPSEVIVTAVSEATDTDPLELPPLYDTVDPDAVDALIRPLSDASGLDTDGTTEITLTYAGSRIKLGQNGSVSVRPN
jgi:hypothetical protein